MEIAFTAKVQALGRVAIPKDVREVLSIEEGDLVSMRVRKIASARLQERKKH